MTRISVIVCSLNPRPDYFHRVLDHLKAQTLSTREWELLLVDNASDPPLAAHWDLSWHPHATHLREDELGLTPARLRGIHEANGELLVFVDDDNLLAPDYVERAIEIQRTYPFLTVFGAGVLEPEFELQPKLEVRPVLGLLGMRSVPLVVWTNNPKDRLFVPWGAGLCVTRQTAMSYVRLVEALKGGGHFLDRRGEQLYCGGDDLFSWVSAREGHGFGLFPGLRLTHLIRSSRVEAPYLLRLVHDHAYSHALLRYLLSGEHHQPLELADKIRLLLHGLRRGQFSMRCQWAAARGAESAFSYIAGEGVQPLETVLEPETASPVSLSSGNAASTPW